MTDNNENIEANVSSWMPDVLGNGFHMCYVSQGIDYSGNVRCAIIRKKARQNTERGVLYIHGFSDYFFQKEMANRFIEQGYNFYAVDLRKYGRSFTQGQNVSGKKFGRILFGYSGRNRYDEKRRQLQHCPFRTFYWRINFVVIYAVYA